MVYVYSTETTNVKQEVSKEYGQLFEIKELVAYEEGSTFYFIASGHGDFRDLQEVPVRLSLIDKESWEDVDVHFYTFEFAYLSPVTKSWVAV